MKAQATLGIFTVKFISNKFKHIFYIVVFKLPASVGINTLYYFSEIIFFSKQNGIKIYEVFLFLSFDAVSDFCDKNIGLFIILFLPREN